MEHPHLRKHHLFRNPRGFTTIEVLTAAVFGAVILLVLIASSSKLSHFFLRNRLKQQASLEARTCLETIERTLSNGKANTVSISTPATTPTIHNSTIRFTGNDGSSYTITWSTSPLNSVHLQRTTTSGVTNDTVLATHVIQLSFSVPDYTDPAQIHVVYRSSTQLDTSGSPDSWFTIFLPDQTYRMIAF